MDESYQNIRRLYLEKLTGMISHEEDRELTELLCFDSAAQHIWENLEQECRDLNADIVLERIDPSQELEAWKMRFVENTDTIPTRTGWV
jgi:hypothetical protein